MTPAVVSKLVFQGTVSEVPWEHKRPEVEEAAASGNPVRVARSDQLQGARLQLLVYLDVLETVYN